MFFIECLRRAFIFIIIYIKLIFSLFIFSSSKKEKQQQKRQLHQKYITKKQNRLTVSEIYIKKLKYANCCRLTSLTNKKRTKHKKKSVFFCDF